MSVQATKSSSPRVRLRSVGRWQTLRPMRTGPGGSLSVAVACWAASVCTLIAAAENGADLPLELADGSITWGTETNGIRAGLAISRRGNADLVQVMVLSLRPRADRGYIAPPSRKFLKLELRDANGSSVRLAAGRRLQGQMPLRKPLADFPHTPAGGLFSGSGGGLRDWLFLPVGLPCPLAHLELQKAFYVPQEGDYSLTIGAAVYSVLPDRQSAVRVNLPSVTLKLHLLPTQGATTLPWGTLLLYIAGLGCCGAGAGWLAWRRLGAWRRGRDCKSASNITN